MSCELKLIGDEDEKKKMNTVHNMTYITWMCSDNP